MACLLQTFYTTVRQISSKYIIILSYKSIVQLMGCFTFSQMDSNNNASTVKGRQPKQKSYYISNRIMWLNIKQYFQSIWLYFHS